MEHVAQAAGALLVGVEPCAHHLRRLAQADKIGYVFGAGPQTVLVTGAAKMRLQRDPAPHNQRADTLRGV